MCMYQFQDGSQCQLESLDKGFCFWHDASVDKTGKNLVKALEEVALDGHCLEGFHLARANLEGIDLVCHGSNEGRSLVKADLYRANLKDAHLFHLNLEGASLMKADCRGANLHFANLTGVNLLGANFDGARIENIEWGEQLLHEEKGREARKINKLTEATDCFEQAEEICRGLRKSSEQQGLFELAGHFFYKEMIMRRFQMKRWSPHRAISKLVDVFCGYGEKPLRVVVFSLGLIFMCGLMYFLLGISDGGNLVVLNRTDSFVENFFNLSKSLYFSVVTFTTLGYGDLVPIGMSRLVAAIEAFAGSFTLALFVVVFVKKMTR